MYTPRTYHRSLRTKSEIINMFANYPGVEAYPVPTPEQIDRIRAVQIAGARHGKLGWYPVGDFSSDADWCNGVGAEIQALENELEVDDDTIFELYSDAHSAFFRDGTINPGERDSYSSNSVFNFHFGAYGETRVSVWAQADHLEDALELAAEWLATHAPGHLMQEGDPALEDLRREVCEEYGLAYPPTCDHADLEAAGYYQAFEAAEADLTYTEAGWLTSYEWTVSEDDTPPGPDASARGPRR